jgi:hypothetical protein
MAKFWFLLTVAFVDLMVAVVLVNWGYGSAAFLFLLMAALLGAYAFFSTPSVQRDPRGRLRSAEVPYSGVLGTVGAIAILSSAGYVAFISSQPKPPEPRAGRVQVAAPRPAPPVETYTPPRSYSPAASGAALYKCVDAKGHASFQSQPCAADATQAWVRDATPDPEPTAAQRRRMALARQAAERQAELDAAARSGGYSQSSGSRTDPGSSPACQAARAADAAYRRQPLQYVTHDGLRRHGDRIQEACY